MNSKRTKNSRLFGILAGLLIAGSLTVGASAQEPTADYFVDGATGDDSDTGATWALALDTLQKALEKAAAAGGAKVIFVATGTYTPDEGPETAGDEDASYVMLDEVDVYGGFLFGNDFDDRDPIANETILSGLIAQGNTAKHIVSFLELTDPAILDGFTVEDGDVDTDDAGGGIHLIQCSDVIIANCLIQDNVGSTGGGLGGLGNGTGDKLEIRNCRFLNNSGFHGGGIGFKFSESAEVNIINCEFSGNDAGVGGGLFASGGDVTVVNSTFTENDVTGTSPSVGLGGGAGVLGNNDAVFINSLFLYNTAGNDGGAVHVNGSGASAILENCTVSKNHATDEGGGIVGASSTTITIVNSILWGNTDGSGSTDTEDEQLLMQSGTATVTYTCIEDKDTYNHSSNIDDDPSFVDEDGSDSGGFDSDDNFRLYYGSKCIDAANNDVLDDDDFDVDEDADYNEKTPDLDFADRKIDDPDTTDSGNGTAPIVDMGAYEFDRCPWDLDGNCSVGATDLLSLLVSWGPCDDCDVCPADFDDNCSVGATDLLSLLVNWGPCPCDPLAQVPTLEEELDDACLSQADWDDYEDVMTDSESSQEDKDRYQCWMDHHLFHCGDCSCEHLPECPSPDPFN